MALLNFAQAYDVLMVAGGYYHENGGDQYLSSVEIIGPRGNSCEIAPLPEPLHGFTMARLGRSVVACGGFHRYERWECYRYSPRNGIWNRVTNLPFEYGAVSYPASAAGDRANMYIVGGRRYNHTTGDWDFLKGAYRFNARARRWWKLPDLERATADACLIFHDSTLYLIAGATAKYLYAHDPSKVAVLRPEFSAWNYSVVGELLAPRMWQACVVSTIDGEEGIVVAGGYYNGITTMFMPFHGPSRNTWRWMGGLPEERKWGAALGHVDGALTIAAGIDYGDDTIDVYDGSQWSRDPNRKLAHKREFSAHATVPSEWFPQCNF